MNTSGLDENAIITFTNTSEVFEDKTSLYIEKDSSDTILLVGDKRYHVHKDILSERCAYLKSRLSDPEAATQSGITIPDISQGHFSKLLQYIYSGSVSVAIGRLLNVLLMAQEYKEKVLELGLITQFKPHLTVKTVSYVLNSALEFGLVELKEACLSFMDSKAPEMLLDDRLQILTEPAIIKVLSRDTFVAPEIDIFKSLDRWCARHWFEADLVLQCIRLPFIDVVDMLTEVRPTLHVTCESIVEALAERYDVIPMTAKPRTTLLVDENLASPLHQAEVMSGQETSALLTGNRNVNQYAEIIMDGQSGFIIRLKTVFFLNHIHMRLWDGDARYYSYYIEVSVDQKSWRRIVDFSRFACRSVQHLYFEQELAQYIKIVGTYNTASTEIFHLVYVEVYFKSTVPKFLNGILYPDTNVATAENNAKVIEGDNPDFLLNGDFQNYDQDTGYTSHIIGQGQIVVQLAQPYMISCMKLLLWDKNRSYKYFIETSVDKREWEIAVDRRNEASHSWQNLHFTERAVVFVKITGTYSSKYNIFQCVHFECPPAQGGQ